MQRFHSLRRSLVGGLRSSGISSSPGALFFRASGVTCTRAISNAHIASLKGLNNGGSWSAGPPSACLTIQNRKFISFVVDGNGGPSSGLSRRHEEQRVIGYSPDQLFEVASAVNSYNEFIPWCQKSRILRRKGEEMFEAELEIGYGLLTERYRSQVKLHKPALIETCVRRGNLFRYLKNRWEFRAGPIPGSCDMRFLVDFQFLSPLYAKVADMSFEVVMARIMRSFEERCRSMYGPSAKVYGVCGPCNYAKDRNTFS
ncbi:hypothetical protein KP509_03G081300 [Ceratopteris richardii]|uniref:Coenzyme Q-binding protein COQ10 START domain-containing protein n=1 Tax=Ceratopteris richardii TaxID=49495 RepID=A0A8T2V1I5_CERRI|nr:hypothetical protein KP509_03G081300 [Ceratopteris richardii]